MKQRDRSMIDHPLIHWHLELSSKCTLSCPRCPRTEKKGMYKVTEHTLDFVKKILPPDILTNVVRILLCGGQGDPIYCHDFIEIIRYIKNTNPKVHLAITTNGSYKKEDWWQEVGLILNEYDTLTFSVDGWDQDSNNLYRVNSDFESILSGIRTVRKVNPKLSINWSTILFKFNQDRIKEIAEVAKNAGASEFILVRSALFGSNTPAYIDANLGYDPLEPTVISDWAYHELERAVRFDDVRVIDNSALPFLTDQMINTRDKYKQHPVIPLCVAGDRGLYVDAEGILYPCSWISHPFGKRHSKTRDKVVSWKKSLFVEYKEFFDLNRYSLSEIISSSHWQGLKESWKDSSKMFVECESKCNNKSACNRIDKLLNVKLSSVSYEEFIKNIG